MQALDQRMPPSGHAGMVGGIGTSLVEGCPERMQDIRSLNQTRVQLEFNAGFQGACAGLVQAPGSWEVCLQVRELPGLPLH